MRENKIDMDLIIKCVERAGGTVVKSEHGHGGIYLKGKELTIEEIKDILMNGPDDEKEIIKNERNTKYDCDRNRGSN